MKKILLLSIVFLFVANVANAVLIFEKKLKVVTTSPYISSIVQDICKNKIITKNIFFNSSPSAVLLPSYHEDYEIDANVVKEISKNNIVLYHSWQPWIKSLKYKISKFGIVYRELKINGNLMVPEKNLELAKEITGLFSVWDSDNIEFYEQNFVEYSNKVNAVVEEIKKNAEQIKGIKVVCNKDIKPFMVWLGFNVVAEYGDSEYVTAKQLQQLRNKIKKEKVKYVVDCLQAGTDVGRILWEEMSIKHIVISDIPLANSYIKTLEKNCEAIFNSL